MTKEEAILTTQEGWSFVMRQGAMLALMPIEDWIEAFEHADSIAPILDPTLYREGIYSGKPKLIREVLEAALAFKRAILRAQEQVKNDPRLQR
jgi:hypothetical protein